MHVQQRSAGEVLWDLCPTFVLSAQTLNSAVACDVRQWQGTRQSTLNEEPGAEKKVLCDFQGHA